MFQDYSALKAENCKLCEELTDVQARSMRDNLLFFGFAEEKSIEGRKSEDCRGKVLTLCRDTLAMDDVDSIKLPRVHRIGKYTAGKVRPIVPNFLYTPDKVAVKQAAFERLKDNDYRVSDQYPRAIQEKRRQLIPDLKKARADGYDAIISYDKLLIRGRKFHNTAHQQMANEQTATEAVSV
ncbi:uncharacterized protein LOC128550585 [Mercenaria mercenaria]|uniref:uncharacterized protein LOC128550585 n=1 Tax=Mercenaria mercenaria TaxID=6596 RepID=UPI00234F289E|nr:uncharacterized protein LOC128550585 [Mercenaria mercenaria]